MVNRQALPGKPILGQIDSKQATNILIIVVRYFGGTLLGMPGLINAYKTSAALALQVTPLVERPVLVQYWLQFDYTQMNNVMKIVKQYDCTVKQQDPDNYREQLFCIFQIAIPKKRLDEVLNKLKELQGVEIEKP